MQIRKKNTFNTYVTICLDALTQPAFTYSKSTMETPEQGVFIVNFEVISHIALMFPLLTLNK